MAVMISEDKKDLVVTCRCGCEEGVHITISHEMVKIIMHISVL